MQYFHKSDFPIITIRENWLRTNYITNDWFRSRMMKEIKTDPEFVAAMIRSGLTVADE